MWSDPDSAIKGFGRSERGAGYTFGGDVVNRFLELNGLDKIVRAHQLCNEGYKQEFDGKLTTVWSVPNYCYRIKNLASILEIDEDLEFEFNVFSWSTDTEIEDKNQQTREFAGIGDYFE